MIEQIKIGCASTKTTYGHRLDTTLVELNSDAKISGLFTSNKFKSAPVQICLDQLEAKMKGKKMLAINAGNANAATGKKGVSDAKKLIQEISNLTNISTTQILPFSTGVVGQLLDVKQLSSAFNKCFKNLSKNSWDDFAKAIMTTDTKSKIIKLPFKAGSKKYHIVGIAKGVGMIEPNMATTLSYVFTDLKIPEPALKKLHKRICDKTFNAFSKLSEKLVLDGEGSTKLLNIKVTGLSSEANCRKVAMKIANSPLVKTAAYGEDPNWGRIIAAAGNAEVDEFKIENLSLKIGKHFVLKNGNLSKNYKENFGQKEFKKRKINLELSIGKSKNSFTVIGSDLSKEYISINSDYRS